MSKLLTQCCFHNLTLGVCEGRRDEGGCLPSNHRKPALILKQEKAMTYALTPDQRGVPRKQSHIVRRLANPKEGCDGRHPQPAPHHPRICKRTLQDPTPSNVRIVLDVLDELRHACSSLGNGWTAQLTHDADKLVDVKVYTSTHDQKGAGT